MQCIHIGMLGEDVADLPNTVAVVIEQIDHEILLVLVFQDSID